MNRNYSSSRIPSCSSTNCSDDCPNVEDLEPKYKKTGREQPVDTVFCEDCSELVYQRINDAEQSLLCKENFICLLQEQLEQLKDRNVKSINAAQEIYCKYGIAQQELLNSKHICTEYYAELQKLRAIRCDASDHEELTNKLREEAEKWKKQYEYLVTKVNLEGNSTRSGDSEDSVVRTAPDEEKWRSIIQREVTATVNILKENSQVAISSLEKHNKNLETVVENLQEDLDAAARREEQLQKALQEMENKLANASLESVEIKCGCGKNYEDTMQSALLNNKQLKADLEKKSKLYTDLQNDYEGHVKCIECNLIKESDSSVEISTVKDEYRALTRSLSSLSEGIVTAKENALAKNEELRQQVVEMGPAANMKEFINRITESLESIEMECISKADNKVFEPVTELNNSIADVEKINKLNSDIELKICEIKNHKRISFLQDEKNKLKEDMEKKCENLLCQVRESNEKLELMCRELKSKNDVIENQCLQISNLSEIIENEKQKNDMLENDNGDIKKEIQKEKTFNKKLSQENEELRSYVEDYNSHKKSIETENIRIKSCLCEKEKDNEVLSNKLQKAFTTINEMKARIQANEVGMEILENANEELKETVQSLENAQSAQNYEGIMNNLVVENNALIQQLNNERDNIASMKKHIDSLQFYHENEMKTNNARLDELRDESNTNKIRFKTEIDKLTNMNLLLQQKLNTIEDENKQLQNIIIELNNENKLQNTDIIQDQKKYVDALDAVNQENIEMKNAINVLCEILEVKIGEKVNCVSDLIEANSAQRSSIASSENSDNLVDKPVLQKVICIRKFIESANEEQNEAVHLVDEAGRKIISCNNGTCDTHLDSNVDKPLLQKVICIRKLTESSNEEQNEAVYFADGKNVISCNEEICGHRQGSNQILLQKVNSIEKKIDQIVDDVTACPEETKCISMPNLDEVGNNDNETLENVVVSTKSEPYNIVRKSSSLELISTEKPVNKTCCESKWGKNLESINQLRTELTEILANIDENKKVGKPTSPTGNTSKICNDKYKYVMCDIQRQINELQKKSVQLDSKNCAIQEELKGIKGQTNKSDMEDEVYRLRRELYKQKKERLMEVLEMICYYQKLLEYFSNE